MASLEVGKEDGSNADSDYDQDDVNPYSFDEEQLLDPYITTPETETIQVELTVGAKIEDLKAAVLRQRGLENRRRTLQFVLLLGSMKGSLPGSLPGRACGPPCARRRALLPLLPALRPKW